MEKTEIEKSDVLGTLKKFFQWEAVGGVLLAFATILALIVANTSLDSFFSDIFKMPVIVKFGDFGVEKTFLHWINDGLMVVFFFMVGLELKREWIEGELSKPESRVLPGICAIMGMLVPALIYIIFNYNDSIRMKGWAIPAATDIAFALGVLSLFGKKVPVGLKVFLVSLAIMDDVGVIIIIAIFYTAQISQAALIFAGSMLVILWTLNKKKVYILSPYLWFGLLLWLCVLKSGVHATLAGVLLAFFIPIRNHKNGSSPLRKLEHELHPLVMLVILPLFAFANARVPLNIEQIQGMMDSASLGVILGLVLGKPIGILLGAWLGIKVFKASLPEGMNQTLLIGLAFLCGIGFTMSLFITTLAFEQNIDLVVGSRMGILVASLIASMIGALLISIGLRQKSQ